MEMRNAIKVVCKLLAMSGELILVYTEMMTMKIKKREICYSFYFECFEVSGKVLHKTKTITLYLTKMTILTKKTLENATNVSISIKYLFRYSVCPKSPIAVFSLSRNVL